MSLLNCTAAGLEKFRDFQYLEVEVIYRSDVCAVESNSTFTHMIRMRGLIIILHVIACVKLRVVSPQNIQEAVFSKHLRVL